MRVGALWVERLRIKPYAQAVAAAFPDAAQQAAVLRWIARGLAVELAIRKGQVDAELAARAGGGRRS